MSQIKIMLGWRDNPEIAAALDRLAETAGVDRSDIIRMAVRDRIRMEADSVLENYKKHK
jgi:hypothetical protein